MVQVVESANEVLGVRCSPADLQQRNSHKRGEMKGIKTGKPSNYKLPWRRSVRGDLLGVKPEEKKA